MTMVARSPEISPRIVYTPALVWKPCFDRIMAVCYLASKIPTLHVHQRSWQRYIRSAACDFANPWLNARTTTLTDEGSIKNCMSPALCAKTFQ
ncbi:hypothetical protein IG631_18374 [Alternaria alternata]|jgi:hypothetical protein|nr:hypothetical protein IG631_18374 [Alternaria alternata]